jgi:hypothetical protein
MLGAGSRRRVAVLHGCSFISIEFSTPPHLSTHVLRKRQPRADLWIDTQVLLHPPPKRCPGLRVVVPVTALELIALHQESSGCSERHLDCTFLGLSAGPAGY